MSNLIGIALRLLVDQFDDSSKIQFESITLMKQLESVLEMIPNEQATKDREVRLVLIESVNNLVYSFKSLISKKDMANIVLVFLSEGLSLSTISECVENRILLSLLNDLVERA